MLVVLVLGTFGFATIGTLLATMAVQTRSRETLLPLVMMPTALPILMLAVRASRAAVLNEADTLALLTLLALDILYLTICTLMFEYVIES
jgi:heme exporter protein B